MSTEGRENSPTQVGTLNAVVPMLCFDLDALARHFRQDGHVDNRTLLLELLPCLHIF